MHETPTMASAARASSYYSLDDFHLAEAGLNFGDTSPKVLTNVMRHAKASLPNQGMQQLGVPIVTRRVVQVFVADPNENISLDDCILFKGEEKVTDLTDQELFFELDIKDLLAAHNAKRTKVIDKKVKDRTEYLEPAKVRDLKMVVVTVANL